MAKYILFFGILISLLIRVFFISQSKHIADIYLMYTMGAAFLEGHNPYLVLDFNSYPPLAIYLEAASMIISSNLHTSFVTVFKFWPNLADFISALIIYKFLIKLRTKPITASFWSVFFLLNPISIIISSAHGQIDSIPSLFVLLSIFTLTFYSKKFYIYLSALFLGLAITVKPNPSMLIPLFLFYKKSHIQQKIIYLILSILPLLLSLIPFIGQNPGLVLSRMLSYSGVNDIAYAAVLRGIWYQSNAVTNIPLSQELLNASKLIFATGALSLTLIFAAGKNLPKACLVIYLLFLSLYFGIGSQYLIWVIPLSIIAKDRMIFYYTFFGLMALLGFYLFFGPDILLGKLSTIERYQTKYIYLYFLGNLMFWIFTLTWLIKIVISYLKSSFSILSLIRKRLIYLTSVIFILSLFPMINLIIELFRRFALGE